MFKKFKTMKKFDLQEMIKEAVKEAILEAYAEINGVATLDRGKEDEGGRPGTVDGPVGFSLR